MSERIPTHNEEAERAALGAMLFECDRVAPMAIHKMKLPPEAFYVPANRMVYEAIVSLFDELGHGVDWIPVAERLKTEGKLEQIGGTGYLSALIDAAAVTAHAEYYLDIVRQNYVRRRIAEECGKLESATHTTEKGDALLAEVPDRFGAIIAAAHQEQPLVEVMDEAIAGWEDARKKREAGERPMPGLALPWTRAMELTSGLEVGITIIAGRPSAGKTTLEDCIVTDLALEGVPVARATLDSTREQLVQRMLSREGCVSLPKLKFGYAGAQNIAHVKEARDALQQIPSYINDRDRDISGIVAWARHLKLTKGIKVLTVDYIQLVGAACMGRSEWETQRRVSYVSGRLKDLAFELRIPVVVLSQLNRAVEKGDRDPELSDLRDSGAIEQDADKVLFLYIDDKKRNEMEAKRPGATKHKRPVWMDLKKQKNGETGKIPMWMLPPYFSFREAGVPDSRHTECFWDDEAVE